MGVKKLQRQMRPGRTRRPPRSDLVMGAGVLLVGILQAQRG